jgi:hypothetical protein
MKFHKSKLNLFCISFFISSIGYGATWQSISKSQTDEFFVDISSISGPPQNKTIDVKRNIIAGPGSPASILMSYKINCPSNEMNWVAAAAYKSLDLGGAPMEASFPDLNKSQKAIPNTAGSLIVANACSDGKPSQANTFVDVGGFDNDFPQSPKDPKRVIRIEIAQYPSKQAAVMAGRNMNEAYFAIQSNKSGTVWRLIGKGIFSSNEKAQPHIDLLRNEKKFPSPRIVSYSPAVDGQIVAIVNKEIELENQQITARNKQAAEIQAVENAKVAIDKNCMAMIKNKYEYITTEKYTGKSTGRKFSDLNLITEYPLNGMAQNAVYPQYGPNNVRLYNSVLDKIEGGNVMGRDIRQFACIVSPSGQIVGIERN